MISITPLAQEKLTAYLAENKIEPAIRVYIPEGGCGGGSSQISLSMDKPGADDLTVKVGEIELCMSKDLFNQVGKVAIDFKDDGTDSGFVVDSEKPVPAAAPSDCSSCSCCG